MSRTIAVDLDQTLCWTTGSDYVNSTPIEARIEWVRARAAEGANIVIWTGRGQSRPIDTSERKKLYDLTKRQLLAWNVPYTHLYMDKRPYDLYVDDKSVNTNRIPRMNDCQNLYPCEPTMNDDDSLRLVPGFNHEEYKCTRFEPKHNLIIETLTLGTIFVMEGNARISDISNEWTIDSRQALTIPPNYKVIVDSNHSIFFLESVSVPTSILHSPEVVCGDAHVPKTWGHEEIIVNRDDYCAKRLVFDAGACFSLHYHVNKQESWYVYTGSFDLYSIHPNTAEPYIAHFTRGQVVTIPRGISHQLLAKEDACILEVSTQHRDSDSYRIWREWVG